jgi:hypothetical protein
MKSIARTRTLFPSQLAFLVLASAIAIPALDRVPPYDIFNLWKTFADNL